jgi:hypothetical protein
MARKLICDKCFDPIQEKYYIKIHVENSPDHPYHRSFTMDTHMTCANDVYMRDMIKSLYETNPTYSEDWSCDDQSSEYVGHDLWEISYSKIIHPFE